MAMFLSAGSRIHEPVPSSILLDLGLWEQTSTGVDIDVSSILPDDYRNLSINNFYISIGESYLDKYPTTGKYTGPSASVTCLTSSIPTFQATYSSSSGFLHVLHTSHGYWKTNSSASSEINPFDITPKIRIYVVKDVQLIDLGEKALINNGTYQPFSVTDIYSDWVNLTKKNFIYKMTSISDGSDSITIPGNNSYNIEVGPRGYKEYDGTTGEIQVSNGYSYGYSGGSSYLSYANTPSNVHIYLSPTIPPTTDNTIIDLGASGGLTGNASFDVKDIYPNYSQLTANNFIVNTNSPMEESYDIYARRRYSGTISITATVQKTYDPLTGILSCPVSVQSNDSYYGSSIFCYPSVHCYLVPDITKLTYIGEFNSGSPITITSSKYAKFNTITVDDIFIDLVPNTYSTQKSVSYSNAYDYRNTAKNFGGCSTARYNIGTSQGVLYDAAFEPSMTFYAVNGSSTYTVGSLFPTARCKIYVYERNTD